MASARTMGATLVVVASPAPRGSQLIPFHAAILLAKTLPTYEKDPAMTSRGGREPSPSGSQVVIALTKPSIPGKSQPGSHSYWHCAATRAHTTAINTTADDG